MFGFFKQYEPSTKKYELLKDDIRYLYGRTLYRIRALKDFGNIKKGDLGGYVEKEANLSHEGLCWISEDAEVHGNAFVYGDAEVSGNAEVYGDAKVSGNALVYEDARVSGNARVYEDARVSGNAEVYGDVRVYEDARVYGNARVCGYTIVSGNAEVYGDVIVYEDARVYGNARVCGYTRVYGNAEVYEYARVYGNARVCGDTRVYGDARVSGNARVCDHDIVEEGTQNLVGLDYNITIAKNQIRIGCKAHSYEEWDNFSDEEIEKMDGKKALGFWKNHKDVILRLWENKYLEEAN